MQSILEKFENTFLYLPFLVTFHTTRRVPPPKLVSREQKFGNIGEMAGLDHRCSQGSLSSSKREDHENDVRCGRLTTELTMATRPRAQVNDLRMLYWLLKTATGSRFQTARPEK